PSPRKSRDGDSHPARLSILHAPESTSGHETRPALRLPSISLLKLDGSLTHVPSKAAFQRTQRKVADLEMNLALGQIGKTSHETDSCKSNRSQNIISACPCQVLGMAVFRLLVALVATVSDSCEPWTSPIADCFW